MNKYFEKKYKNVKNIILIFLIVTVVSQLYYFFYNLIFSGVFFAYGNKIDRVSFLELILLLFLYLLIIASIYLIIKGFLNRDKWVRKFSITYFIWTLIWPIWGFLARVNIFEQIIFFVLNIIFVIFLMTTDVKNYFETEIYVQNNYYLYKRNVKLKNGKKLDIYFFSKHKPKSGEPCSLPEGYEVKINPRSNMPFLKKKTTVSATKKNKIYRKNRKKPM